MSAKTTELPLINCTGLVLFIENAVRRFRIILSHFQVTGIEYYCDSITFLNLYLTGEAFSRILLGKPLFKVFKMLDIVTLPFERRAMALFLSHPNIPYSQQLMTSFVDSAPRLLLCVSLPMPLTTFLPYLE